MTGKELADKYCIGGCSVGLCNCIVPVMKCPYIKAQEALQEFYKVAMVSYEKIYQDGTEYDVARMDGYLDGIKAAMRSIEGL